MSFTILSIMQSVKAMPHLLSTFLASEKFWVIKLKCGRSQSHTKIYYKVFILSKLNLLNTYQTYYILNTNSTAWMV